MALGEILREARLKKRLTASEVASGTHMKVQTVEAIEREDFHKIPAPLYCKGFIKLYAEFVGLDPDPLLHEYIMRFLEPAQPLPAPAPVQTAAAPSAPHVPNAAAHETAPAGKPASAAQTEHDLFSYARNHPHPTAHPAPQAPARQEQVPMFAPPSILALPKIKEEAKRISTKIQNAFAGTGTKTRTRTAVLSAFFKDRIVRPLREKQILSDPRAVAVLVVIVLLIFLVCVSMLSTMCAPTDTHSLAGRKLSYSKPPEHYHVPVSPPLPFTD